MASLVRRFRGMRLSAPPPQLTPTNKEGALQLLFAKAKALASGDSCKEKIAIGEGRRFSFLIGNKGDVPFAVPYSVKKKSPWEGIVQPVEIGKGNHNRALKSTEFSPVGERKIVILKSNAVDEQRIQQHRKIFEETASALEHIHADGELEFVEKRGVTPRCKRGVRITELFKTDLYKLDKDYTAAERAAIIGKILKGLLGVVRRGYYPMDIKLANVLVDGDKLVISDLDRGFKLGSPRRMIYHSPKNCSPGMGKVAEAIVNKKQDSVVSSLLEKELVFQVAIALLELHQREFWSKDILFQKVESHSWEPFGYKKPHTYTSFKEDKTKDLTEWLEGKGYPSNQVEVIIGALSNKPESRPSLKQMAIAFP